jgi:HEPN domain-containing protein
MNEPLETNQLVHLWVDKAESDHRVIQQLLKMGEDCPIDAVCYHAQQCVEKYLKARLVYLGILFPKTHDIGDIIGLLPPGTNIPLNPQQQEKLTDYIWIGRYPGDWGPVTRQQAEEAAVLALQVRTTIRAVFPKEALK